MGIEIDRAECESGRVGRQRMGEGVCGEAELVVCKEDMDRT